MPGKVVEYRTQIREAHLDTFGHVNNAQYLMLFEEARWELITQGGYGLAEVRRLKKGPVILEVNVKFKRELKLREKIRLTTELKELNSKIGRLEQILYNEAGEVSAVAEFVMGFFDTEARKLIAPTPEWLKAIGWTV